jgi:hypothetical protein
MVSTRDDFSKPVKRTLSDRVAWRCSNPDCHAQTSGPHEDPVKSVNIGVAAHIRAASVTGPRYDPSQTPEERRAAENGLWLCQSCAKHIDSDVSRFTPGLLAGWKSQAEALARSQLGKAARQSLSLAEGIPRSMLLQRAQRHSVIRCCRRWTTLEVAESIAYELATDPTVGCINLSIDDVVARRLTIIVGDFGTGKSLGQERLFQDAIAVASSDVSKPVPQYIDARDVASLECELRMLESSSSAMFLFVDNADSVGADDLEKLLLRLEMLASNNPESAIVVTSREMQCVRKHPGLYRLPRMDSGDAASLLNRIAKGPLRPLATEVTELLQWPIFVVLLGSYLAEVQGSSAPSVGDLLSYMADRSYKRVAKGIELSKNLLRKLAVLQTNAAGSLVALTEVASYDARAALLDSGLVDWNADRSKIGLTLPIFTQWFAAQALECGLVQISDTAQSEHQLTRWREALLFAIGFGGEDFVDKTMTALCKESAGFASSLLVDAKKKWFGPRPLEDVDSMRIGKRIRIAAAAWLEAIGPLAVLADNTFPDGSLAKLGIRIESDATMHMGWYVAQDDKPQVFPLPDQITAFSPVWRTFTSKRLEPSPIQVWYDALTATKGAITKALDQQTLCAPDTAQEDELAYRAALAMLHIGSLSIEPISFELLEAREELSQDFVRALGQKAWPIEPLRRVIGRLKVQGNRELRPPWPTMDVEVQERHHRSEDGRIVGTSHLIWDGYSREQVLRRASFIFQSALDAYIKIVSAFFPSFSARLQLFASLPVEIHVEITREATPQESGEPWANIYYLPRSKSGTSTVKVEYNNAPYGRIELLNLMEEARRRDASLAEWASPPFSNRAMHIFGPTPITDQVFDWLASDFKRLLPLSAF